MPELDDKEPPKSADELEAELQQLEAEIKALEASEQAAAAPAQPAAVPLHGPIGVPMRAPADVSSVSHDGQEFVIPFDRICDVPVPAREAFRAMGFTDVEE